MLVWGHVLTWSLVRVLSLIEFDTLEWVIGLRSLEIGLVYFIYIFGMNKIFMFLKLLCVYSEWLVGWCNMRFFFFLLFLVGWDFYQKGTQACPPLHDLFLWVVLAFFFVCVFMLGYFDSFVRILTWHYKVFFWFFTIQYL